MHIRQHMHEIVIHIIRLQTLQLFTKKLLKLINRVNKIVGHLRGNLNLLTPVILRRQFSQHLLIAPINISRIKIIHSMCNGIGQLPLCFFHIHTAALFRKTHTSETENRPVILSIFHIHLLHFTKKRPLSKQ